MPTRTDSRQALPHAALVAAGIIWGTPFLVGKIALEEREAAPDVKPINRPGMVRRTIPG